MCIMLNSAELSPVAKRLISEDEGERTAGRTEDEDEEEGRKGKRCDKNGRLGKISRAEGKTKK